MRRPLFVYPGIPAVSYLVLSQSPRFLRNQAISFLLQWQGRPKLHYAVIYRRI